MDFFSRIEANLSYRNLSADKQYFVVASTEMADSCG